MYTSLVTWVTELDEAPPTTYIELEDSMNAAWWPHRALGVSAACAEGRKKRKNIAGSLVVLDLGCHGAFLVEKGEGRPRRFGWGSGVLYVERRASSVEDASQRTGERRRGWMDVKCVCWPAARSNQIARGCERECQDERWR
jgi:hypothetical protein